MKVTRQVPNDQKVSFYVSVEEFMSYQVAEKMKEVEGDFYTNFTLNCNSQEEAEKFESLNF